MRDFAIGGIRWGHVLQNLYCVIAEPPKRALRLRLQYPFNVFPRVPCGTPNPLGYERHEVKAFLTILPTKCFQGRALCFLPRDTVHLDAA